MWELRNYKWSIRTSYQDLWGGDLVDCDPDWADGRAGPRDCWWCQSWGRGNICRSWPHHTHKWSHCHMDNTETAWCDVLCCAVLCPSGLPPSDWNSNNITPALHPPPTTSPTTTGLRVLSPGLQSGQVAWFSLDPHILTWYLIIIKYLNNQMALIRSIS